MKKILVTGSLGQIGSELTMRLRELYGEENVLATDIRRVDGNPIVENGLFDTLDVLDGERMQKLINDHHIDTIIHLAALLSVTAEKKTRC
ncbi:hypothetical protein GCM10020331_003950 [Ectobacillus funiculus]